MGFRLREGTQPGTSPVLGGEGKELNRAVRWLSTLLFVSGLQPACPRVINTASHTAAPESNRVGEKHCPLLSSASHAFNARVP